MKDATVADGNAMSEPSDDSGEPSLLVVDDDASIREMLSFKFDDAYDVITRENGEECLAYFNEQYPEDYPDVVILDVMMPGRDGLQILREIRDVVGEEPVGIIVISGSGQEDTATGAFEGGADDFIMKPVSLDELSARISRLLP